MTQDHIANRQPPTPQGLLHLASLAFAVVLVLAPILAGAQSVYHRGNTGEPETLDQHITSTTYEAHILRELYEGLVAQNAKGEVIPGVAQRWDISDDGRVYTFYLRDDAMWSNGDRVTAGDFVFSLRRILTPDTGAKYANILYPIEHAQAINKGEQPPDTLAARAIDEGTLEITLRDATPYFLELLTHQTGLPVHPPTVQQHDKGFVRPGIMVSNGAYTLKEQIPQAHILLEKNPNFHDATNVSIDQVYFYPTEDRGAALRRVIAGELHSNNDIPDEEVAWVRENHPEILRTATQLGTYYYAVDHTVPPFDDVRVRTALSMMIDREYLTEEITGSGEVPAYGFVPPGIGNYGEPAYASYRDEPMIDRIEKAGELLREAGFGPDNPLQVEIRYNTSENHKKIALAIADMWADNAVQTSLLNTDVATHYGYLRDGGAFNVARAGWIGDYNDPQNFLFLVQSDNQGFNYAKYNNPEYDRLMDEAAQTIDLEERAKILYKAEELFIRDLPYIPIYYYVSKSLVAPSLKGWEDNPPNVHPTRFMSIE
ncbi:MAG: peptide ABC transporter substrate-binding protein [Pseudomonadota bacterium]